MTSREAADLLRDLILASHACLDLLKIPHTPPPFRSKRTGQMVERTRPWRTAGGPEGIAYHYTGGMNGIKSLRWFNDPSWGNEDSSAHVLIFDRLVPELAETWAHQKVASVFRVPTLIIADITKATWATNWANARCLGVENRNGGGANYDEAALGKPRVSAGGKLWEPYTREQLECNIMLGRMFRALRGDSIFTPEWVVGHSMIWATKSDPGPCFPLHQIREAIWSDEPLSKLGWLAHHPLAIGQGELADEVEAMPQGDHSDPAPTQASWDAIKGPGAPPISDDPAEDRVWVATALYRLGWFITPQTTRERLRDIVAYYQRSTLAHSKDHPTRVLKVDGFAGPKTRASIKARLAELGA